jgi:hypothetical protein
VAKLLRRALFVAKQEDVVFSLAKLQAVLMFCSFGQNIKQGCSFGPKQVIVI